MHNLLRNAVSLGSSDLHIAVGFPPIFRLRGELKRTDGAVFSAQDVSQMVRTLMTDNQIREFEKYGEVDFAYEIPGIARFRTNVFQQMNGDAAAFRVIPSKIMTFDDLGAPPGVYQLAKKRKGLILVTGPTGSGKSTTLAAMIYYINKERKEHILTIEDPIEYVHNGINCLINQREVGRHTNSFANALRAALREDPDVILVGEMRDLETISLAITAAETGHLVLATLHTSSAPETVDRVIDVFPTDQQNQIRSVFSSVLQGVIAQKLIPGNTKSGRTAVMEVMLGSNAIRNLIRERKTHQMHSTIQTSADEGMRTMDQALMEKLEEGVIEIQQAKEHALDKKPFDNWKGRTRNILDRVDL